MNRIVKAVAAAALAVGLAVVGVPQVDGGDTTAIGSSGCCKR